ncbi:MAG: hypothetical protein ACLR7U_10500 [Ruthenibacterium lactatiformans]
MLAGVAAVVLCDVLRRRWGSSARLLQSRWLCNGPCCWQGCSRWRYSVCTARPWKAVHRLQF